MTTIYHLHGIGLALTILSFVLLWDIVNNMDNNRRALYNLVYSVGFVILIAAGICAMLSTEWVV